ncbi:GHMP kinase [Kordia sp. YSTF-M3]|uniref:GHMP kinase n=1 Tax=Kordia aestuariivivens TaxID=2759037 RepID=A0ABR7Q691_9FLAO|nr:GHMP kinase [Kordia aestuariivivens]MBC8754085.1 GHMP kinase [Kordia aestuariivivens]
MIITRTPFRISFVGGGTDIPEFYQQHKGAVLSTSINKYMYISSHPFFDKTQIRLKYSQTETITSINDIKHELLKRIFTEMNVSNGIELSSIADIVSGTGMGSSSSFTVGVLHNLAAQNGALIDKNEIAKKAYEIERSLYTSIGKQDQYAASYGGLNMFEFLKNGEVIQTPILLNADFKTALNKKLVLFYIGSRKSTKSILKSYEYEKKKDVLIQLTDLVYDLKNALERESMEDFGSILHEGWLLKKSISNQISNDEINTVYDVALKNGATGGKLLGAGTSGFMLFYCEEKYQAALIDRLQPTYRKFDFSFEENGTKVIFQDTLI